MKLLLDIIWCILSGIDIGFTAFLKALPIYNELGNIKEEIIACAIGAPAIVVSAVLAISTIVELFKKKKA